MLKRWMALCLIGLLVFPFLGAAAAGDTIYTVFFEEDFEGDTPVSLAVFQNQLYALGAEGIYLLNPAEGTVRRLTAAKADITDPSTAFSGITHLFADKEGLLGYENDTKTLYRVHLNKTPVSKTPLLTIDGEEGNDASELVFGAPYLYIFEHNTKKLSRLDIYTQEIITLPAQDVRAMTPYKDGSLLAVEVIQGDKGWIRAYTQYDFKTGERSVLGMPNDDSLDMAVAYDAGNDLIYSASATQLFFWRVGEEISTPLSYVPRGDTYGLTLVDNQHAAVFFDGRIAVRPLLADAGQRPTLRVLDPIGRAGDYAGFLKEHKETDLVFLDAGNISQEERFLRDMRAQSGEVDIYLLRDLNLISRIKKEGFAADLSGIPEVKEMVDAYEQPFYDTATQDGKILLFYKDTFVNLPVYSISLFEQLGFAPPTTFLEYYQLCERYITEKMADYPDIRITPFVNTLDLPTVLTQIAAEMIKNGQELDFETPKMKALLAQIARVAKLKTASNPDADQGLFDNYILPILPEDRAYMLLTLKEGNAPALVPYQEAFSYFVINPYTQNQELALQFMQTYARTLDKKATVLRDTRAVVGVKGEGWHFSGEEMATARSLAKEVTIPDFNPICLLVKEYPDFFEEYLTNPSFDPGQFLAQLNQMVKTALIEQE